MLAIDDYRLPRLLVGCGWDYLFNLEVTVKYFAFDPGNEEFDLFDTEDEAKNHAQSLIDGYRGEGDEGWPEWTGGICWGQVMQRADARLFSNEYNPDVLYEEYKLTDVE